MNGRVVFWGAVALGIAGGCGSMAKVGDGVAARGPRVAYTEAAEMAEAPAADAEAFDTKREQRAGLEADPPMTDRAGLLTASEWRDNDAFAAFLQAVPQGLWGLDLSDRIAVTVTADGAPVVDAHIELLGEREQRIGRARTDNRGRAFLFPRLASADDDRFGLVVRRDGQRATRWGIVAGQGPVEVELPKPVPARDEVDVMFVIDATGSMGDEMRFLQNEIENVAARVQDRSAQELDLRYSVNFYRDHGDAYVVRSHPFERSVHHAQRKLAKEHAAGGGDTPEAVDEALDNAVFGHRWRKDALARLCFLVLDAPPHENQKATQRLHQASVEAAAQGIRLIPVVASGMDRTGEQLTRSLAVATGGTYVFITDDSGIGGAHRTPDLPATPDVEPLNDLLVRVIGDYTNRRGPGPAVAQR